MEPVTTFNTGKLMLLSTVALICVSCTHAVVTQQAGIEVLSKPTVIDPGAGVKTPDSSPADYRRATNTTLPTIPGFSLDGPIEVPVTLHSTDTTGDFDIVRTDGNGTVTYTPADGPITAETFVPTRTIRVTGSYYPIGIYGQPHNYATLIMRVPPGTLLPLIETSGEWLSVSTEKGVGFIRRTDAVISDTPIQTQPITG